MLPIEIGLLALLCLTASCSRSARLDYEGEQGERSIGWLKSCCTGDSHLITGEITVQGRIVANDAFGEWSRSLVFEDATGGLTLYADASELADRYPFGASVVLYANGLRLYDYGGKIVIGASAPNAYGGIGIPAERLASHLHRTADAPAPPEPRTLTLMSIGNAHVDTYVRITDVRFVEAGSSWCDRDPATGRFVATARTIADDAGNTFTVWTSAGCDYAAEPLPAGRGSICGVIDRFNGRLSLRVVNREIAFP